MLGRVHGEPSACQNDGDSLPDGGSGSPNFLVLREPMRDTDGVVQSAFVYVVAGVCAVGVVGAVIALLSSKRDWARYGSDRLVLDSEEPRAPAALRQRDEEVRQMLEARNARRRRRGEPEIDVAAELARLTTLAEVDDELREEIRQLVVARNHRRARKGLAPLDVETEIQRELAGLSGVAPPLTHRPA